ncbi:MAG TPA: molybdenum cofactor guanylyltransferase MobA [Acetobacteraceae bacterium]|nr:molybdenum cofactor guanylyltransferase MobA [Acetobacteraceae bacterium]
MIAGIILAGGGARRMGGGDKCLLKLGSATILDMLLPRLAPQVCRVAISANDDPGRFAGFALPVLPDAIGAGPLAGVAAGLAWASAIGAEALLTVPGDTPFIPPDLADRLVPAPAWAASEGAVHPLVALWPVAAAGALDVWLAGGTNLRVRDFGQSIGMRTIDFADTPDPFFNINTPDDLREAGRRLSRSAAAP